MHVGHCQTASGCSISLEEPIVTVPSPQKVSDVHRQRRSPGVVSPSAAFRGSERTLEPRQRQAPAGVQEGSTQTPESTNINPLFLLGPAFPLPLGPKKLQCHKKLSSY